MFERILPQENTSLHSLSDFARMVGESATLLSEMVGSASSESYPEIFNSMLEQEAKAQDHFYQTMTKVRSTFTSALPREDMYALATHLMSATEHLTSAGHLVLLNKIERFRPHATTMLDTIQREAVLTTAVLPRLEEVKSLDQYWMNMMRITRQATRTAEVYAAELIANYKPDRYLKSSQFIEQLKAASDAMRAVSVHIGRIIVQES